MSARPLSLAQARVWQCEQFQPGTPASLLTLTVDFGQRDPAGLRAAWHAVITRHPPLSSHYTMSGGQPAAVPADGGPPLLPVTDLRYLARDDLDDALAQVQEQLARRAFDLAGELPVRGMLVLLPARVLLVLTAHRIAIDVSAAGLLLRELLAWPDEPPARPAAAPGVQPARHAEGDVEYWRAVLRDLPPATLLTDRPRLPAGSRPAASVGLDLPAEAATLDADALLAIFQALLVRLGADSDVAVTLVTGQAESVESAAPRAVIRAGLSDDPGLGVLRARIAAARGAAAAHPVPFEVLASELAAGDPRLDPFCTHALVLRDQPLIPRPLVPVPGGPAGTDYELALVLEPDASGKLGGELVYATDLFEPVTAERIAARYGMLLAAAVAEPLRPLAGLPLVTDSERELILRSWNAAAAQYRDDRCLHDLIADQARRAPDALAVICGEQSLSYAELDGQANGLAGRLLAAGAGPGRLAAICTRRSPGTIVALLAVLKAGAAYVPLDAAYPPERLAFLLADSQAAVVITDAESQDRLRGQQAPVVLLDQHSRAPEPEPPPVTAGPQDPCYVIYTSGSTGQPKGAVNCHRGVLNTMTALISRMRLDSGARLLQTSSLSFDMATFDILAALLAGACIVVPEPADAASPAALIGLVHRHRITVWSSAPPLFRAALDEALTSEPGFPDHLDTFMVGGDKFPPAACAAVHELLPHCRVFNLGGMTEVSFTTTAYRIRPADGQRTSVPWGRPLPGQRMYVLDRQGQLMPPGMPGELYIGGAGVGLGYWNRPELTRQRFLPDPFGDMPQARMYRTGDKVRMLPDGNIEFLGRLDHQVKVRGFRIELGEVEAALLQHPLIGEAVAGVRAGEGAGDQRLVGYVTFADVGAPATVEELRAFLLARLPEHMVPGVFAELPGFPLLPSGKVDRRALDAVPIPAARPNLAAAYLAPRDELEQRIAQEWAAVLGLDRVGADDEFVALGGHSMLATATMTSLARSLRISLSARDLLAAPTPARLAARIRQIAPDRDW